MSGEVAVKGLVMLSVFDHIARKSDVDVGALVGYTDGSAVTVTDAFELANAGGVLLQSYLEKKLSLLQTITPNLELLGLYSCKKEAQVPRPLFEQLHALGYQHAQVFITPSSPETFRCISACSGNQIDAKLVPGESEQSAVSTVLNHANYSQEDQFVVPEDSESWAQSFLQLEVKLKAILAQDSLSAASESHLVHLAHLVKEYRGEAAAPQSYELQTSHLSLLTSQLAALNTANSQVERQKALLDKGRYRMLTSLPNN